MDDLFEKLRSEPPVNSIVPVRYNTNNMPPPKTPALKKANYQKTVANQLKLPKYPIKPLKVLIERKKFNTNSYIKAVKMEVPTKGSLKVVPNKTQPNLLSTKKRNNKEKQIANRNLIKIRKCFVKLQKHKTLLDQIKVEQNGPFQNGKIRNDFDNEKSKLEPTDSSMFKSLSDVISRKHSRPLKIKSQSRKFTIQIKKTSKQTKISASSVAKTKFPRSQLVTTFGKRFFQSRVRIERVKHPLMLIFEAKAKDSLEIAKGNRKSKNLSVSFLGQVEVFGESSTDDEYNNDNKSNSDSENTKLVNTPKTRVPIVALARLKNVKNCKIVDEVDLVDQKTFSDESENPNVSSVPPKNTAKRIAFKQKEKISYSPLKQDSVESPRKDELKKANERIPKGFHRYDVEEDDEDSVEYIVPIEILKRRLSRTRSLTNEDPINIDDNDDVVVETVIPDIEILSPSNEIEINETIVDEFENLSDNCIRVESFCTQFLSPVEDNRIVESPQPTHMNDSNCEKTEVTVIPDDHLVCILNNSLESVLPSSIDSNIDENVRENIVESALPEISSNTFDNIFVDDGNVFISNLNFSSEEENPNLTEKSTMLQHIIDEQEKINIPEVLFTDDQSVHSINEQDSMEEASGANLNLSKTAVPDECNTSVSEAGKFSFSRILNSVKARIEQSYSSTN